MDEDIAGGSVAGVLQKMVYHGAANTGDQVKAPLPEALQQRLGKIAFISKDLPLQSSGHGLKWFVVVPVPVRLLRAPTRARGPSPEAPDPQLGLW